MARSLTSQNCMTILVKVQRKGQVTLPTRLRSALGIGEGDMVEASVERGKIVLTPRVIIDRAAFPTADDDYTPAQRRVIDARLAQSHEDVKKRRTIGPFDTADAAIASMKLELTKRAAAKKSKRAPR
jgi:AbrB family looped-hinge helix DNA binding protein